jgi:dolichol kinase
MVDLETRDEAPSSPLSDPGEVQYQLFVTLWLMAFTFHFFERDPLDGWPLILTGILCLIFPNSFAALAGFVV